jgi:penicillin-binding protein 1A
VRSLALLRLLAVIVVAGIATSGVIVAALPAIGEITTAHDSTSSLPPLRPLAERSEMFDSQGNKIGEFKATENRQPITFDEMPVVMRQAILAIEDAGFYRHEGVNVRALMRATLANVSAGGVTQGGSTITQQLIKNALVGDERNIDRKVAEAMYAMRLEDEMTKDEILERYLNTVYFGSGAYGIEAAAEVFFGKRALELTLPEAAFLAGLVRAPGSYDPFRNPERSRARRDTVLDRMEDEGWATEAEVAAGKLTPIPTEVQAGPTAPPPVSYFVDAAKEQMLNDPKFGDTYDERYDLLFRGGLRIETTFDPGLQFAAEAALKDTIPPDQQAYFTASIVALDPRTGAVRAMVGGPGFNRQEYNIAIETPGRQAGSSFKTFVLAAAVEAGATSADVVNGAAPCTFRVPGQPDYTVRGGGAGVGSITSMTERSINCAYLRLGQAVGLNHVTDVAERMGITSPILQTNRENLSLSIGEVEVNPLEMASAYGTLANDGKHQQPYLISRVLDQDGEVIYEHTATPGDQVITPETAARVTDILRSPIFGGSGTARRNGQVEGFENLAGKTGTNDNYTDAWFVGYSRSVSVAVWMGSPLGQVSMRIDGQDVTGGSYPTQMWNKVMAAAMFLQPDEPFAEPPPPPNRRTGQVYNPGTDCEYRPVAATQVVDGVEVAGTTFQRVRQPSGGTGAGVLAPDPIAASRVMDALAFAATNAIIAPCDRAPAFRPAPTTTTTTVPGAPPVAGATTVPGAPPPASTAPPTTAG